MIYQRQQYENNKIEINNYKTKLNKITQQVPPSRLLCRAILVWSSTGDDDDFDDHGDFDYFDGHRDNHDHDNCI